MQVNFKGLYAIIGKEENLRNMKRKSVQQISTIKFNNFLEDTEKYKVKGSYLYQNDRTGDYFISIKRENNYNFEDIADEYNIDYYKVGDEVTFCTKANKKIYNKEIDIVSIFNNEYFKKEINRIPLKKRY